MGLSTEINQLKNLENSEAGVLSIYLSTKPEERSQWKTHLKNGFKQLEQQVEGDAEKHKAFQELKGKVEQELKHSEPRMLRSLIVFAEGSDGLFEVHFLQLDVDNEFVYGDSASTSQLEALDRKFPQTGIVVAQTETVTVHNSSLGEIDDSWVFELDLDTDDWRKFQGRSAKGQASSSSQVDQFDNRKEKQIRRFYRELSAELAKLHKEYGWSELVLIGHQRPVNLLEDELDMKADRVVNKNLGGAEHQQVLQAAFE
ncbi:VLRF1 family aeRF1-type release factor [Planococcus sp. A6]|uniref:VLRF1 family aeRF1-type release factor n=1 Tax=Planococcus sp. A6 TaxID=2992760 RepID=UPI00237AFEEC|nr:VLRF1 family aeRF1-type release factor [Planococcus sp. A6]MDE0582282.1 VLRF1 family aeRF1-type release factor [Planococcus sp. A6]